MHDFENSYWNSKGQYQHLVDKLNELIPISGPVTTKKSSKLERFRKIQNAYYDLFNNGGMNRARAIARYFGVYKSCLVNHWNLNYICSKTEPVVDEAILAAAKEQGLI